MADKQNRKLAAILFADIVGYTAIMQKNEKRALASLLKFKTEIESKVPIYYGEIIQFYGDGCLVIFNSSVDAVACAKELQTVFQEKPSIPVRIGLHAGEVVFRDENVFGDAVNIASRVESLGIPGAILLSSNIRNQIKNKSEFQLVSLGRFEFKNVEGNMTVYALANEGIPVPKREEMAGKLKLGKKKNFFSKTRLGITAILILMVAYFFVSKNKIPSTPTTSDAIAIFPFDIKGNDDLLYLGDGMVDLISTKLDEIPGINPIDPNRLFGKLENISDISRQPEKAADISRNLGANKFILGNIVEIEDALLITASKYNNAGQLLDKKSVEGNKNKQLARTIDELVKQLIVEELKGKGEEFKTLGAMTSSNMESLKAYLKGEQAYRAGNHLAAYHHFVNATQLDSTFAMAWMRIVDSGSWDINMETPEAYENWNKYQYKLPKKWQEYHNAYMLHVDGNQKTVPAFKKLIQRYGESRAFFNGIAEFYWHFNPVYGRDQLEAKPYLERTLELEPSNMEAFIHLSECALLEADTATLQDMLDRVETGSEIYPDIQIKNLMLQDSVTNEEIMILVNHPHFRDEFLFRTLIPIKKQPVDYGFLNRILAQYPDKIFSLLSPIFENGDGGREKTAFQLWKKLSTRKEDFYISLSKNFYCMPATLMADKSFLPLAEYYLELFDIVKDKDSPWEIYAAIKYAIALNKTKEVENLKNKLTEKINDSQYSDDAKYYFFSLKAFEARMAEDNDAALIWIDSAYQYPNGFWEIQTSSIDKTIMQANIYAENGEYEKAISYFENLPSSFGPEFISGYAINQLSNWYEKIGNRKEALVKCNLFLENYKNCDPKYRPWLEEVEKRKQRLVTSMK